MLFTIRLDNIYWMFEILHITIFKKIVKNFFLEILKFGNLYHYKLLSMTVNKNTN